MSDEVFIHNYKLLEKLGKGAFSTVFKGEHRINKKLVAIKVSSNLKHESKILAYLNRELPGLPNIPTLYWYGLYGKNVCLATTYYTVSLLQYEDKTKLAEKLITAIKHLHSVYIVHSDIKPDNIMVDRNENVVFIDFGLSSLYYNAEKDVYRENIRTPHLIGSPKYASYNLHTGNMISPRDDLISIGYLIMTALGIELPWSSVIHEETDLPLYHVMHPGNVQRAKCKNFETLKMYLTDFPNLFAYMEKVYALEYGDTPDYKDLLSIF
jgi:serine/threonine protein kinase